VRPQAEEKVDNEDASCLCYSPIRRNSGKEHEHGSVRRDAQASLTLLQDIKTRSSGKEEHEQNTGWSASARTLARITLALLSA
jgi:hypothetical protein